MSSGVPMDAEVEGSSFMRSRFSISKPAANKKSDRRLLIDDHDGAGLGPAGGPGHASLYGSVPEDRPQHHPGKI